jgi:hypothetical protein
MATTTINLPMPFPGSPEERHANYLSHSFLWDDEGDTRCAFCDCRPSYVSADWPCMAEVPRIIREVEV